jgi:hypothetical protein
MPSVYALPLMWETKFTIRFHVLYMAGIDKNSLSHDRECNKECESVKILNLVFCFHGL